MRAAWRAVALPAAMPVRGLAPLGRASARAVPASWTLTLGSTLTPSRRRARLPSRPALASRRRRPPLLPPRLGCPFAAVAALAHQLPPTAQSDCCCLLRGWLWVLPEGSDRGVVGSMGCSCCMGATPSTWLGTTRASPRRVAGRSEIRWSIVPWVGWCRPTAAPPPVPQWATRWGRRVGRDGMCGSLTAAWQGA